MKLIQIVHCSLGKVRIEWAVQLASMQAPMGRRLERRLVKGETGVDDARNKAIHQAFKDGCEYIFFYDDDVIPVRPGDMARMINTMDEHPELTALGGVYPARRDHDEVIVCKEPGEGTWWGWRDGGLHEVFMTGTGFMIVRLEDIADLPVTEKEIDGEQVKMFFRTFQMDRRSCTDDFWFGSLLRAHTLKWAVDGSILCYQIDHDGTVHRVPERREVLA